MDSLLIALYGLLDIIMFLVTVGLHLTHKRTGILSLYVAQSACVGALFALSAYLFNTPYLALIALGTIAAKVFVFPALCMRLFRRLTVVTPAASYLSAPSTLTVLFAISLFSLSALQDAETVIPFAANVAALGFAPLHLAGILAALFLAVHRKDAYSQIIALLTLENWVAFIATRAGFHHTLVVEFAITLEIVAFSTIAITLMVLLFNRFGNLDVSHLTHLSERDE